jgi:hypothetical protein
MRKILVCMILLLVASLPAAGQRLLPDSSQGLLPETDQGLLPGLIQGITSWTVDGDTVHLTISLPGGLTASLSLVFEDVVGLNLGNLGISTRLINPFDLAILTRLQGLLGSLLPGFPLLLRIEPPASGGLAFSGVVSFEIYTNLLHYTPGCPLRLFAAPLGGPFVDVTTNMGAGSYRARGSRGGFSEFLIVADLRPVDQVIRGKLDRLEDLLDDYENSMPGPLYDDLSELLSDIRADHARGATTAAINGVDDFLALVEQHAGTSIPNVWRSARDVENVAGYLRAGAKTLRFSLAVKNGSGFGF